MPTEQPTGVALYKNNNGFVPTARLDQVIPGVNSKIIDADVAFMTVIPGEATELTEENKEAFFKTMVERTKAGIYTTVDHLPIRVVCADGLTVLYVSLDNCFLANQNGHALHRRFPAIVVMLLSLTRGRDDVLLFFSEACRYSVDTVDGKDGDRLEWMDFVRLLGSVGFRFLGEKPNNEDLDGKSYGLAAFALDKTYRKIVKVLPKQLITRSESVV